MNYYNSFSMWFVEIDEIEARPLEGLLHRPQWNGRKKSSIMPSPLSSNHFSSNERKGLRDDLHCSSVEMQQRLQELFFKVFLHSVLAASEEWQRLQRNPRSLDSENVGNAFFLCKGSIDHFHWRQAAMSLERLAVSQPAPPSENLSRLWRL